MKPVRIAILTVLVLSFLILAPVFASNNTSNTPVQIIENFNSTLLSVMKKAKVLGYEGRYNQFAPVVKKSFDFPLIAKIVLGRYWSTFTEEEKAKFIDIFTRLSIATYANRFDNYSGEKFKIVSTNESRPGRALIKTMLIKSDGKEVELDYILLKKGTEWRIVNVIADGVSDLSLKRADYTAFLKKNSVKALFDRLNKKIADYAS
jgi:phospholipid transport system substrate-binding protein